MAFRKTGILLLLCSTLLAVSGFDQGFELLYKTNMAEYDQKPVKFEKPLPPWMNGTYIANGLGKFEMGKRNVRHFFDGFSKLVGWTFIGGDQALFSNKFLRSSFFKESVSKDDIAPYSLFMNPNPDFGAKDKLMKLINGQDNANVNIVKLGADFVAVGDFYRVYEIDEQHLGTVKAVDPKIPKGSPLGSASNWMSTSHPVPEYGTNNMINTVSTISMMGNNALRVVRCTSSSDRELIAHIPTKKVPYIHSFSATEKYVLLFLNPMYIDFLKMLETLEPASAMVWDGTGKTTVKIVEIATGDVTTLETEAVLGLHHVNSYTQDDGTIVVDIITYPDDHVILEHTLENLLDPKKRNALAVEQVLKRYVIDLKNSSVHIVNIPTLPGKEVALRFDLPTFNEKYRFRKYCFVYGVAYKMDRENYTKAALIKKDLCDPSGDKVWYQENHYAGEPRFVPNPDGTAEDDGYLLVTILDGEKKVSYMAVLEAQTMELVNKCYLPVHIPMRFHGRYFEQ